MILLQALIQLDRKVGADTLEHLHDNDEQDNSQQHDQILVAVIAVVNGNLAQPAAAHDTTHGGVAQDGGDGDGGIGDEGGHRLRDHDLNDGLHGAQESFSCCS